MSRPDARAYVDWDGIRALPPADAQQVLAGLSTLGDNPFTEARLRLIGATVHEEMRRHRPGARARAAKTLALSPARLGQLYDRYKEKHMIAIPNVLAQYDLLDEVEEHFDTRQGAHDAIHTYLDQIIYIDGEDEVIMDRKPLKNASGRVIGETLWVTEETAEAIREAITASNDA